MQNTMLIFFTIYFDVNYSKNDYDYCLNEYFGYSALASENMLNKLK